ncbi:MAG: TetR/AcrR family transcriptional regulator [Cryobacterium sp.]|uniref:TetR/AcrR family transcriptional regulator n=1 Tax=unclassified Cryobacterium TaxID=2649013 RepID=UPI0018C8EC34|nr:MULTISPECIES: TetR/AcrR family transcriptional regulator [unclassified Cryobacterium]MCY7403924.1 TetR/AcrR family transcriptional regulator [Cryobacterium sp.]MEC5153690.1 AcrR family transcriptional regulator [Cryobacterium sp. CAN_C3]
MPEPTPHAPNDTGLRPADAHSRVEVADIAVRLFQSGGYEATTATDIAAAAGVSRSTFFRQFGSKDDVIFADHDELLEQISGYFAQEHADPWLAVCEAAALVFERFRERLEVVRMRDLLVRQTVVLRDRETVMVSRYEKVFAAYLRGALPEINPLTAIRFAAAVTATHNFELRRLIRGAAGVGPAELAAELAEVRRLLSPAAVADDRASDLIVAVFPASASVEEIARAVQERLRDAQL